MLGSTQSLVNLSLRLDAATSMASITIAGPSAVWFGVGFNAQQMGDEPWTVIVDGTGAVTERKLVDQKPGTQLVSSVKVVSNTVSNGVRTVELSRPFRGAGPDYYSFTLNSSELPFINAVGSGPQFTYHKSKMPSSLLLLPEAAPACVCAGMFAVVVGLFLGVHGGGNVLAAVHSCEKFLRESLVGVFGVGHYYRWWRL